MDLLLDPHGDDGVLFSCLNLLRHRPLVVVTNPTIPVDEIANAVGGLGCQLWICDPDWDWGGDHSSLASWLYNRLPIVPDHVFAPAWRENGHEDHNLVAAAAKIFGERVTSYLTYAPRGQRDRDGQEVAIIGGDLAQKLRALSCYESQIDSAPTRPWFLELLDLREWVLA